MTAVPVNNSASNAAASNLSGSVQNLVDSCVRVLVTGEVLLLNLLGFGLRVQPVVFFSSQRDHIGRVQRVHSLQRDGKVATDVQVNGQSPRPGGS